MYQINWVHEDSVAIALGILLGLLNLFAVSDTKPLPDVFRFIYILRA